MVNGLELTVAKMKNTGSDIKAGKRKEEKTSTNQSMRLTLSLIPNLIAFKMLKMYQTINKTMGYNLC